MKIKDLICNVIFLSYAYAAYHFGSQWAQNQLGYWQCLLPLGLSGLFILLNLFCVMDNFYAQRENPPHRCSMMPLLAEGGLVVAWFNNSPKNLPPLFSHWVYVGIMVWIVMMYFVIYPMSFAPDTDNQQHIKNK